MCLCMCNGLHPPTDLYLLCQRHSTAHNTAQHNTAQHCTTLCKPKACSVLSCTSLRPTTIATALQCSCDGHMCFTSHDGHAKGSVKGMCACPSLLNAAVRYGYGGQHKTLRPDHAHNTTASGAAGSSCQQVARGSVWCLLHCGWGNGRQRRVVSLHVRSSRGRKVVTQHISVHARLDLAHECLRSLCNKAYARCAIHSLLPHRTLMN